VSRLGILDDQALDREPHQQEGMIRFQTFYH